MAALSVEKYLTSNKLGVEYRSIDNEAKHGEQQVYIGEVQHA